MPYKILSSSWKVKRAYVETTSSKRTTLPSKYFNKVLTYETSVSLKWRV